MWTALIFYKNYFYNNYFKRTSRLKILENKIKINRVRKIPSQSILHIYQEHFKQNQEYVTQFCMGYFWPITFLAKEKKNRNSRKVAIIFRSLWMVKCISNKSRIKNVFSTRSNPIQINLYKNNFSKCWWKLTNLKTIPGYQPHRCVFVIYFEIL